MKLKFKKGTKLYTLKQFCIDENAVPIDSGKVLEEDFTCDKPDHDTIISIAGVRKIAVTKDTTVPYEDGLYLKVGDAANYQKDPSLLNKFEIWTNLTIEQKLYIYLSIIIVITIITGFIMYKTKH